MSNSLWFCFRSLQRVPLPAPRMRYSPPAVWIQITRMCKGNQCFLILTLTSQNSAKAENSLGILLIHLYGFAKAQYRIVKMAGLRLIVSSSHIVCSGSCACLKGETCKITRTVDRRRTHTNNIYPQLPDVAVTRVSMR